MVAVYGGFASYGLVNAPMQIRLAVDSSGSLVNSWVEVSVDKATATPMSRRNARVRRGCIRQELAGVKESPGRAGASSHRKEDNTLEGNLRQPDDVPKP
jgi:hypothetical protein